MSEAKEAKKQPVSRLSKLYEVDEQKGTVKLKKPAENEAVPHERSTTRSGLISAP